MGDGGKGPGATLMVEEPAGESVEVTRILASVATLGVETAVFLFCGHMFNKGIY